MEFETVYSFIRTGEIKSFKESLNHTFFLLNVRWTKNILGLS